MGFGKAAFYYRSAISSQTRETGILVDGHSDTWASAEAWQLQSPRLGSVRMDNPRKAHI